MARVNFFLVFEGRAGSGLLRAILNSSPSVVFKAEWMMFDLRKKENPGQRQVEQVERFFKNHDYSEIPCVGFANKLSDIVEPKGFGDALEAQGARLLSLKRRNLVKQVVSNLNALRTREVTGKAHAYRKEDILADTFEIDLPHFDAHLRRLIERTAAQDRFVEERPWLSMEVFYEDLISGRESTIRRIAKFLETPKASIEIDPPGKPLKQSPTNLRNLLTNFDALRARYTGTAFQNMLDDSEI